MLILKLGGAVFFLVIGLIAIHAARFQFFVMKTRREMGFFDVMNGLKYICLATGAGVLIKAAVNVQECEKPINHHTAECVVSHFDGASDRICAAMIGMVFIACSYGIQKRSSIVWALGWPVLMVGYILDISDAIVTARNAHIINFSSFWLPLGSSVIFGTVVVVGLGFLWMNQKAYFIKTS